MRGWGGAGQGMVDEVNFVKACQLANAESSTKSNAAITSTAPLARLSMAAKARTADNLLVLSPVNPQPCEAVSISPSTRLVT